MCYINLNKQVQRTAKRIRFADPPLDKNPTPPRPFWPRLTICPLL